MSQIIVFAIFASAAIGIALKVILDRRRSEAEISTRELVVGVGVAVPVVVAVITIIGWNMAVSNKVTFHEYWNGWELAAKSESISCTRDGQCRWEYDCDPYSHIHVDTDCDSKGKCTTDTTFHTHYHSCPYVVSEGKYWMETTLGKYEIARGRLPLGYLPWRVGVTVPQWVVDQAGVGSPPFWLQARDRIDLGNPSGVTVVKEYPNLILTSDETVLRQNSDSVEFYRSLNLLPPPAKGTHDYYFADKVAFVGSSAANEKDWQKAVANLNAALGNELKGDLRLVIVADREAVRNPARYTLALQAYWLDPKFHGRDTVAKNTVTVVVATRDNKTVDWARCFTGMPVGNEFLIGAVNRDLEGTALEPDVLVGAVQGEFYNKVRADGTEKPDAVGRHGNGKLEKLIWGLDDPNTRFSRVSMQAKDSEDLGPGFRELWTEIEPDEDQKAWILIAALFLSLSVWFILAFFIGQRHRFRSW